MEMHVTKLDYNTVNVFLEQLALCSKLADVGIVSCCQDSLVLRC